MSLTFFHAVPGGTPNGPQINGNPHDLIRYDKIPFVGYQAVNNQWLMVRFNGGLMENVTDAATGRAGWRATLPASAGSKRGQVNLGGTGNGLGGFSVIPSPASILSGAVTGYVAVQFGHYFMEADLRISLTITSPAAQGLIGLGPSWYTAPGTLAAANGFGLAWSGTDANDNYRLLVLDGVGPAAIVNIDTGIAALDDVSRILRVEWGWIAGAARIRGFIDGVQVAEQNAPITLNTTGKLGAFNQMCSAGAEITTNSGTVWLGETHGVVLGRVDDA